MKCKFENLLLLEYLNINIDELILKKIEELKKRNIKILHEGRYGITLLINNLLINEHF